MASAAVMSIAHTESRSDTASLMEDDPSLIDGMVVADDGQSSTESKLAQLNISEMVVGRRLGSGGFSVVHEVSEINLRSKVSHKQHNNNNNCRENLARSCVDKSSTPYRWRYVIKMLRRDLPDDERTKGVADLAIEARFLSTLKHPNIISMVATSDRDPLDCSGRYFLVLERLNYTLEDQLGMWRRDVGKYNGCFFGCCRNAQILHDLWVRRFEVTRDIACAIRYLHHLRIVYRDLKPENVGFDDLGTVKLFDFGLAKALPSDRSTSSSSSSSSPSRHYPAHHLHHRHQPQQQQHPPSSSSVVRTREGLYKLTGNTGSLRYMAPEVALGLPYDLRVDAYSFGVLFWQICALSIPYGGYTCKMHADYVVGRGHRPKINTKSWPTNWGQLMRECWSEDLFVRPDFDRIVSVLDEELLTLEEGGGANDSTTTYKFHHIKGRKKKAVVAVSAKGKQLDVDTRLSSSGEVGGSSGGGGGYSSNMAGTDSLTDFDGEII